MAPDPRADLLEAALGYAERGWAVFPCHPETKQPLVAGERDPQTNALIAGTGGLKKASTNPSLIDAWWTRWPKAMIGLPVGRSIGAFVIDIDAGADRSTGECFDAGDLLHTFEETIGQTLPRTWTSSTPRGGRHLYFATPPGTPIPGNRAGVMPRIDVRGDGGYVIVPPSRRADGASYAWIVQSQPSALAAAPDALLDLVLRKGRWSKPAAKPRISKAAELDGSDVATASINRYGLTALESELRALRAAPEGTRNDRLFRAAISLGQLVGAGSLEEATVLSALRSIAQSWPNVAKSMGTIRSGFFRGMQEPRRVPRGKQHSPSILACKTLDAASEQHAMDCDLAEFDLTDRGNARRFARRFNGLLAFCDEHGWIRWDGQRWTTEGADAAVLRAVHETVDAIKREAEAVAF